MNFKFKIDKDKQTGISFSNNKIPSGLFNLLNKKCNEAINSYYGKLDWIQNFVHFEKDGKKYEQISSNKLCDGCVFNKDTCVHPFFDTKPYCTGKIYIQKQ